MFRSYFNPPHTIFYVAPFVFWGARVLAFVNIFMILILLIGVQRGFISTTLIGLATILTPQILFIVASVNILGLTTALGLWFLLQYPKKFGRAMAWTALSGRPQDSGLLLLVDGWRAFQQRDWGAFRWSIVLTLPTWVLFLEWIRSFPNRLPGNTLSPAFHLGYVWATLYVTGVILIWFWFKSREQVSQYWLLIVV